MPKNALGLLAVPEMRPTPRNKLMGLLADTLGDANAFATQMDPRYADKRQNQTLGLLADFVGLGSLAKTADRVSYGEPLTNGLRGSKPFLKPETADTAMALAGLGPRNALGLLGMGAGMADNGAMRAATVWHGSPHKFDKFDASKIGTGEGAQVYGHGLYLAESPDVARQYADNVKDMGAIQNINARLSALAKEMDKYRGGEYGKFTSPKGYELKAEYEALLDAKNGVRQAPGALYKVDLPDNKIAKMMNWDAPIFEQPTRIQDMASLWGTTGTGTGDLFGGQFLKAAESRFGGPVGAADALRVRGIPGIRYLDAGSRGAGQGTRNYVIFPGEESALTILERNGQSLR